ncbi:uncharacterized protein LOC131944334 [Physella acuta]|uniref:uncharacterized protein LOC131944334 n=1 Tax=Physella acuta TaxID=109671 RepID=UPI0027DD2CA5|nr:uncharacterized protein LOC131944334 [Physella acuta]
MTAKIEKKDCTCSLSSNLKRIFITILVAAISLSSAIFILSSSENLNYFTANFIKDLSFKLHSNDSTDNVDTVSYHSTNISTKGCVFPDVDMYHPDVIKLAGLSKTTLRCAGFMPDLTYIQQNKLIVNKSRIKSDFKSCKYREIFKHPDNDNQAKFGEWGKAFNTSVQLSDNSEFLLVVCEDKASKTISKTYYALTPSRDNMSKLKLKKRLKMVKPKETLNVMMIGMDGTSRHQYIRSMNLTYNYLMKDLNSFDMTMYTQLGLNTFPNYLPLLTGYSEDEIVEWWDRSSHTDEFDLIWGDYKKAGYKTLFSEDVPSIGGFHYQRKGFSVPPTTYYSHPICLAMEKDKQFWSSGHHCAGNQPEINFHLNYVERFFDSFPDSPKFAMVFLTKLTHDDMSNSKMADEHMLAFYKTLRGKVYFNNTLIITFSDHGPRLGPIRASINGIVESRAPYSILTIPKWFLDKYPDVAENMRRNTHRLTTHYDVHATLQDLLYFKASGIVPLTPRKHGTSLFNVIPESRTCEDIPIPLEYCLCNQAQMQVVSLHPNTTNGLGELLLKKINSKRNKDKCVELKLQTVLQIVRIKFPTLKTKDINLYKIKLQTFPGNAVYEGTIRTLKVDEYSLDKHIAEFNSKGSNPNIFLGEDFDRLTLYRGQADCEEDASKKPYCYCQSLVKS